MSFRHADSLKAWMRLSSSFCDAHTSHPCVTTGLTKAFNNRSLVMELTDLFSISSSTWPMSDHHRHTHGRSQLHLISTVAQAASFVVLLHRYTKESSCSKISPYMHTNCINLVVTVLSEWISLPTESLMHGIIYPLLSVLLVYPPLVLGALILEIFWNVIVVNLKDSC